jgi:hypothetical protein
MFPRLASWAAFAVVSPLLSTTAATMIIRRDILDYTTAESGNPIFDGWYADPDTGFYNGLYWVFPTYSAPYNEQTFLDAFSSPDLIHWTKHEKIVTIPGTVSWGWRALWAPAHTKRNGRYYLYFGLNDIQSNDELGGIGVVVADKPEGPYSDPLGKPLIDAFHNGAQPIDQDVFVDDDGQAYIYYGGWGHCNVAKMNSDMISLGTFDDGATFKEITPTNYVEGAQMFKRNGKYYLMWSEGGWTGPDYSVSYGMADSPLGPFPRIARILQQNPAVAKGSGHNGVINVPGTDIWYIIYHRRPLSETNGNHRQVAYDRMYFNADGTIQPVQMLVKDNFEDGNMLGWRQYLGRWTVVDGKLHVDDSVVSAKAMLDTNFGSVAFDADVGLSSHTGGDAGLVFRATRVGEGIDQYRGYYAAISGRSGGGVLLGKAVDGTWQELGFHATPIAADHMYHLRATAFGGEIKVYFENSTQPILSYTDPSPELSGQTGVRVFSTAASFDNVVVASA